MGHLLGFFISFIYVPYPVLVCCNIVYKAMLYRTISSNSTHENAYENNTCMTCTSLCGKKELMVKQIHNILPTTACFLYNNPWKGTILYKKSFVIRTRKWSVYWEAISPWQSLYILCWIILYGSNAPASCSYIWGNHLNVEACIFSAADHDVL